MQDEESEEWQTLVEEYGPNSCPVMSYYIRTNEKEKKTDERAVLSNKRHGYPSSLVSNETMTFDPRA